MIGCIPDCDKGHNNVKAFWRRFKKTTVLPIIVIEPENITQWILGATFETHLFVFSLLILCLSVCQCQNVTHATWIVVLCAGLLQSLHRWYICQGLCGITSNSSRYRSFHILIMTHIKIYTRDSLYTIWHDSFIGGKRGFILFKLCPGLVRSFQTQTTSMWL